MKTILFVCTGNTCRSSMAEGLFNHTVQNNSRTASQYSAASAGIYAGEGDRASTLAVKILKGQWGIDISAHRSRPLNLNILKEATLILTMTRSHKAALLSAFPQFRDKTFTLKEYIREAGSAAASDQDLDIQDPYGGSEEEYLQSALEIKSAVDQLLYILH